VPKFKPSKFTVAEVTGMKWLTASLVSMVGFALFYGPQPINDLLLGIAFPIHAAIGASAPVTDYIPIRQYPKLRKFALFLLYGGTILTLYGCWVINTKDVGITAYISRLWHAREQKKLD
ncbi:hypothetical protein BB560_005557, partial [Smittium megazygosporum]